MGKSKLQRALHAEKGTDFKKLKQKKKAKEAVKRKVELGGAPESDSDEEIENVVEDVVEDEDDEEEEEHEVCGWNASGDFQGIF